MSVSTHYSRHSRRPLLTSRHRYPSIFEQFFRFPSAWNTFIYSNKVLTFSINKKKMELRHNVDKQPRSTNFMVKKIHLREVKSKLSSKTLKKPKSILAVSSIYWHIFSFSAANELQDDRGRTYNFIHLYVCRHISWMGWQSLFRLK